MGVDANAVLRDYLTVSGTALNALVGERVYAGRAPALDVWSNDDPAVLFWRRGGNNDPRVPVKRPSWQVECYGGSDDLRDAEAVYDALEERLRAAENASTSSGVLVDCIEEASGQDLVDDATGWPFVLSFWGGEVREAD